MRLFTVLMLVSCASFAQQNAIYKSVKILPTSLPTRCVAGNIRVSSAGSDVLSYCNPANTWNTALVAQSGFTFSGGDIVYSTPTSFALLAAGTSGQILTSAGASAPTWSSKSYFGGYMAGDCGWTSNNNSMSNFTAIGACTLATTKSFNFPSISVYDSGGSNFLPGITFTPAAADVTYQVCATSYQKNDTATSSQAWLLTDLGGNIVAGTRSAQTSTGGGNVGVQSNLSLCGFYETNTTSSTTLVIRHSTTSGTTTLGGGYSGTPGNPTVMWSLNKLSSP